MQRARVFAGVGMAAMLGAAIAWGSRKQARSAQPDLSATRLALRETRLPFLVYCLYLIVKWFFARGCENTARRNACTVIRAEQRGGFFIEVKVQQWLIAHAPLLVKLANGLYVAGYFGLLAFAYALFYLTSAERFRIFKQAFAWCAGLAMVVFWRFPTAPPRKMAAYGFIDTDRDHGMNLTNNRRFLSFFNEYAAMPSLHFAWAVLVGLTATQYRNSLIRAFGFLYPCFTAALVLVTGHHYLLDLVGGGVVAGLAFAGAARCFPPRPDQSRRTH